MAAKKPVASSQPAKSRKRAGTATRMAPPARTDVFISYSHHDKGWLEQLVSHLRPLERANLTVWVDTKLRSGDKWRTEIEKALAKTRVAILLVSHRFLASDFIYTNELPPLLRAAAEEGTIILPLLLSTSLFERTPLSEFQSINPPSQPLDLLSEGQVNQVLAQVAQRVDDIFKAPAAPKKKAAQRATPASKPRKTPAEATTTPRTAPPTGTRRRAGSAPAAANTTSSKPAPARAPAARQALLVRRNGEWEVLGVRQSTIGKQLGLTLTPTTAAQTAFLADLRQGRNELTSVAFGLQVYRCTLRELAAVTEGTRESWQLTADWQELGVRTEVTYNGFTPDMQAQARAQLLLLDSQSPEAGLTRWLSSGNWPGEVPSSPFPALYQQLGRQPARFRQVAPLVASWLLHFTSTVQHILRLKLTLQGARLTVDFEGRRETPYRETPEMLRVQGVCALDGGGSRPPLLLGPLSYY